MDKVVRRVGKVSAQIPYECILVYDDWTSDSVHYFGIFAAYRDSENNLQFPLLTLSPLHDEASLDAQSHYEFIVSTLSIFYKSLSSILAVVCDNENTNKALAKPIPSSTSHCSGFHQLLNICERLFSRPKLTQGYSKHSLTPMHLEAC